MEPDQLRSALSRLPAPDSDDRLRIVLGKPDLGLVLELGSKRDLGGDYLVGVRPLSTHAHHSRMAWPARGIFRHRRLRGGDVHLFRCNVPAPRTARLCVGVRSASTVGIMAYLQACRKRRVKAP